MSYQDANATAYAVRPQELGGLKNHQDAGLPAAYGPRLLHLGEGIVPGADLFITSRSINGLTEPAERNVEPHRHDVSQTYLVLGDEGDLQIEVEIDGRKLIVGSPAAVFIPAGAFHSLRVLHGTGTLMSVLRSGRYE